MMQVCVDFRDEVDELHGFLETLSPDDWQRETQFMAWTPWDVVAHLHYFDLESMASLEGEAVFAPHRQRLFDMVAAGRTNKQEARERFEGVDAAHLLERWRTSAHELAEAVGKLDPRSRLPWYGPDMSAQMFITARLMETWAHGQEIYDLKGATRAHTDRVRHIATLGVKTFGWTFVNRKLEIPGPPPHVRLTAPSGAVWEWNEGSQDGLVRGDAVDFCHVVTQGRNVADTALEVKGPVATQWMSIAQCFAGGPADPPAPGSRGPARSQE